MSTIESDEDYNAVALDTGAPYHIEHDARVTRVQAELVISNFEVGA
jgi:hypothetical protein